DGWSLRTSYTFTETEQTSGPNKGDPLNAIPKHMVSSSLNWDATEKLSLFLRGTWRDEEWQSSGEPPLSGYAIFDLGGSYAVNDYLSINAGIFNLADKDTTNTDEYPIIEEGLRLWVSATVTF